VTITEGTYLVINANSLLALDVQGASDEAGANVQQYTVNRTDAQIWAVVSQSTGYELVCSLTGNALDVEDGNRVSGTNVQQYTRNGTAAQRWTIAADGKTVSIGSTSHSTYVVQCVGTSLALDVSNGGTTAGTNVQIYTANQTDAQRWAFVPVACMATGGTYEIVSALDPNICFDVPGQSTTNGCRIQVYCRNGTNAQVWQADVHDDQTVSFVVPSTGKALDSDVNGGDGCPVIQWEYDEANNPKKWLCERDGSMTVNGATVPTYTLHPVLHDGLVADVANGSTELGTTVQLWTPNGTAAQRFAFIPARYVSNSLPQPWHPYWSENGKHDLWLDSSDSAEHGFIVPCSESALQCRYRVTRYAYANRSKSTTTGWMSAKTGDTAHDGWGAMWESNLEAGSVAPQKVETGFAAKQYDRVDVQVQARSVASSWGAYSAYARSADIDATIRLLWQPKLTLQSLVLANDGLRVTVASDFIHGGNSATVTACGGEASASGLASTATVVVPLESLSEIPDDGASVSVKVRWSTIDLTTTASFQGTVSWNGTAPSVTWDDDAKRHVITATTGNGYAAWLLVRRGHGSRMERFDADGGKVAVPYPLNQAFDVWVGKPGDTGTAFSHAHFDARKTSDFIWTWGASQEHSCIARMRRGGIPGQTRKYSASVSTSQTDGRDLPVAASWHGVTMDMSFSGSARIDGSDGTSRDDLDALAYTAGDGYRPVFRTPWGDWERVVVKSVDVSSDTAGSTSLSVSQEAVSE
jgi:hypothetical protein